MDVSIYWFWHDAFESSQEASDDDHNQQRTKTSAVMFSVEMGDLKWNDSSPKTTPLAMSLLASSSLVLYTAPEIGLLW